MVWFRCGLADSDNNKAIIAVFHQRISSLATLGQKSILDASQTVLAPTLFWYARLSTLERESRAPDSSIAAIGSILRGERPSLLARNTTSAHCSRTGMTITRWTRYISHTISYGNSVPHCPQVGPIRVRAATTRCPSRLLRAQNGAEMETD